jgi:hypothetical protein
VRLVPQDTGGSSSSSSSSSRGGSGRSMFQSVAIKTGQTLATCTCMPCTSKNNHWHSKCSVARIKCCCCAHNCCC